MAHGYDEGVIRSSYSLAYAGPSPTSHAATPSANGATGTRTVADDVAPDVEGMPGGGTWARYCWSRTAHGDWTSTRHLRRRNDAPLIDERAVTRGRSDGRWRVHRCEMVLSVRAPARTPAANDATRDAHAHR